MDRYEEALAKARAEYEKAREQGYTWLMGLLEGMFPELKESEDERIRKELVAFFKEVRGDYWHGLLVADILAYLEKEQKPVEWSEQDIQNYDAVMDMITNALYLPCRPRSEIIKWFKSLKNRGNSPKSNTNSPHWKPSKEQMGMLLAVINDPNNAGAESCHLMLQSLFADLRKLL